MYGEYPTSYVACTINITEGTTLLTEPITRENAENIISGRTVSGAADVAYEEIYSGNTYTEGFDTTETKNLAALITSKEQYDQLMKDYSCDYRDSQDKTLPDINEEFFSDNALVVLAYTFGLEINNIRIKDLYQKNGGLYIDADEIIHHDDEPYAAYVTSYSISLNRIAKADAEEITKLVIT